MSVTEPCAEPYAEPSAEPNAQQAARVGVVCLGDVMLDRFITGAVSRISPEGPVPVLSMHSSRACAGGAANVALNIAALGGRCTLLGVCGSDPAGADLQACLQQIPGATPILIRSDDRPTTEKQRFMARGQQLLRVDQEHPEPLAESVELELLARLDAVIEGHQVLVLSDYAKGTLTPRVIRGAIALAQRRHLPVIVDPKSADLSRYAGAAVITPNAKEVQAATGWDPTEDDAVAVRAGEWIVQRAGVESVLVTRAHRGMTLVSKLAAPVHLPTRAREVFDVVGAGDTVVAALALAVGAGLSLIHAARLANVAAGIRCWIAPRDITPGMTWSGEIMKAIDKDRTRRYQSASELAREWARGSAPASTHGSARASAPGSPHDGARPDADGHAPDAHARDCGGVRMDLEALARHAHQWRAQGQSIGLVHGGFSPLRSHDLRRLQQARARCDRLVADVLEAPVAQDADHAHHAHHAHNAHDRDEAWLGSTGEGSGAADLRGAAADPAELLAAMAMVDAVVTLPDDRFDRFDRFDPCGRRVALGTHDALQALVDALQPCVQLAEDATHPSPAHRVPDARAFDGEVALCGGDADAPAWQGVAARSAPAATFPGVQP